MTWGHSYLINIPRISQRIQEAGKVTTSMNRCMMLSRCLARILFKRDKKYPAQQEHLKTNLRQKIISHLSQENLCNHHLIRKQILTY
jgi:hypothetical protein